MQETVSKPPKKEDVRPPISLKLFQQQMGVSACTIWRMRKKGDLRVLNIYGRLYVPAAEAENFNRRAECGDLAQKHPTPPKRRAVDAKRPVRKLRSRKLAA